MSGTFRSFRGLLPSPKLEAVLMGDKSPKSKERQKKQDSAAKSQKKSDAFAKAHPAPTVPGKKGK